MLNHQISSIARCFRSVRLVAKVAPLAVLLMLLSVGVTLEAQTESHVQSTARPMGLDIVNTVNIAGSDSRSANFQNNVFPSFKTIMKDKLGRRKMQNPAQFALDPAKLTLATKSDVRVYFAGEKAGYHNTLGFSTSNNGESNNDPQLIFPDASSRRSGVRTKRFPLQPGDFVDLGEMDAGTQLDFFLMANGGKGRNSTFGANASDNPDGMQHMVAFAEPNSPYLMIAFEDLYGGGDRDFDDAMFIIDMGSAVNVQALVGAPEPSTWMMIGFGVVSTYRRRKKKRRRKR